jgi:hypothetical protein
LIAVMIGMFIALVVQAITFLVELVRWGFRA